MVAIVASGGRSAHAPLQSTFDATNGPHVAVFALPGVNLEPLADLPGLTATSGPFSSAGTSLRYDGREVGARLEARPAAATAVDRPSLVSGEWVRPHTVVLERTTARLLGVPLGGRVTVVTARGRIRLNLGGVAETAARSRYPGAGRGLGYVSAGTLTSVGAEGTYGSTVLLRLADPDRAGQYVEWIKQRYPGAQVAAEAPSRSR